MTTQTLERAETRPPEFHDVDVDVIAESMDSQGNVKWELEIRTHGNKDGKKIDAKDSKVYKIRFDLVNPDRLDVRFDASGPIFVREGGGTFCPTSLGSKQIMIDSCADDELVVIDWNYGDAKVLNYQLNFVTRIGQPVNPYDPIINNSGGSGQPFI